MIRPEMFSPSWEIKPLGEVADFLDHLRRPITARDRKAGPYPYYGANGQQDSVADYLFDEPLILLAEDGGYFGDPEKTIAYRIEGKCWVNNHAHVLRPKGNVDISFLCRQLERYDVTPFVNGATRQKLTKSSASEIPISLPPLAEQKRIATILDKADAIRCKRQKAIKLADDFLRVTFLDMFGDPIINAKKWHRESLESFCSDIVDCPHSTPKYSDEKTPYPCLRSSDLQDGHLVFETTKYVDESVYRNRTTRIKPTQGDIIYCREGARLGNCAIVPEGLNPCLGQRTMLFRVNQNEATSSFLLTLLNKKGIKSEISNKIIGAAAPRVNVQDLREYEIIKPPLPLQQLYEKIVLKLGLTRRRYLVHLQISKQAFNSFTQSAFRGEL